MDKELEKLRNKFTMRKLISIVLYVLILALVGLFQAISMNFDFSIYLSADYWFRIVYRIILISLSYIATINASFDYLFNSQKVQTARKKYLEIVKMKDITFKEFLEGYNRRSKIEAWKNTVNKKIYKLEQKIEHKKNKEKIFNKINDLKATITDEYIENNFEYLDVKYYKVFDSDFTEEDSVGSISQIKTRSNFSGSVARFGTKKLGSYILIAVLSGSIIYNLTFNPGINFWINLVTDLLLVIMRIADALYHAPILMDDEYTNVYIAKTTIMKEYINWCNEKEITESKAHKVISYIEETEKEKEKENNEKGAK